MNLYCNKCLKITSSNDVQIKRKTDGKINPYSCCIDCSFIKNLNYWWKKLRFTEKYKLYLVIYVYKLINL